MKYDNDCQRCHISRLSHSIHLQYEPELDCVLFVMGESEGGKNNGV